jgi:uncharacterized protein (DUF885 family)
MQPTRRELLAGFGAFAVSPSSAAARTSLRSLLDRVAGAGEPARMLAVLRAAGPGGLDRAERVVLRMVERGLEREKALGRAFPFGKADGSSPYVVSQRHGAYLRLGDPAVGPAELDEETERIRSEAARGVAPPAFVVDAVLKAQGELAAQAGAGLRPAIERQMAALRRLPAVPEPGAWRLPGGEDYYRLRLRCTSGLDDGPGEIERRVAAETAALLGRADRLLKGLGFARGSVGERLRALKRRPDQLYPNDERGRTRAVADMNAALARLRPRLRDGFNPPLEAGGSVRRMSAADERAGRRGYRDPATESYYPDLAAVAERPAWTLTTVAFHETVPGHLLQLARQARADPHPLQVRYAPGYSEGWAIHAEALVDSMELLAPAEQIGFIQSFLFRLARVTADIGLHRRRWDRARAIRYLEEVVGFELFFPFAVEVDRYSVEPAGFAGDAMAALALERLRPAGGARLRGFHDAVLNLGPLSAEAIAEVG